jgi:bifunctional DNA-binding transcriptional regulator/antitoxin component of YhaV-PrlF toxin-antitoxin module
VKKQIGGNEIMSRSIVSRSPVPKDLRTAGPCGKVEYYWDLNSFSWYGEETVKRKDPFLSVNTQGRITISDEAAKLMEINPSDTVKIGVNKYFLAVRKLDSGLAVKPVKAKKSKAVFIIARKIAQEILNNGWTLPCKVPCVLDEKNKMLVAKKPASVG